MNILVTGCAGFIGSSVSKKLLERGDTVYGIDNLNDYYDVKLKLARLEQIKGHGSSNSLVTILGLTFKENVPDLRNSKVGDIVNELLSYDVNLQLHAPVADNETAKTLFNIDVTNFEDLKPANAVILAVAHQSYKNLDWSDIAALFDGEGVVFDVKGILPRENIPKNIILL